MDRNEEEMIQHYIETGDQSFLQGEVLAEFRELTE